MKIKNVSSETKSKRILEQKINAVEEKLKKAMKKNENLENELAKNKNIVIEKEKMSEELKLSLDRALCEKQEIQSQYESKNQSLKNYESLTNSNFETLQTEPYHTKEIFEKTKELEQQVLQLQEDLDKSKENLNSSKMIYEIQLQEAVKDFREQNDSSMTQCVVSSMKI